MHRISGQIIHQVFGAVSIAGQKTAFIVQMVDNKGLPREFLIQF
jgi:hypothetical protein